MSRIRILVCRGDADRTTALATFDVPQPDDAGLRSGATQDTLEAAVLALGHAAVRAAPGQRRWRGRNEACMPVPRPYLTGCSGSPLTIETCSRIVGVWCFAYRALGEHDRVIDVYVSPARDREAAAASFRRVLQETRVTQCPVTTDYALRQAAGPLIAQLVSGVVP